nr:hydroxymethylbilane synthase [Chloroflexota bacterium]
MTTVRIGTRGSALALAQARLVAEGLAAAGQDHAVVVIETEGDRRAPDTAWGEGAFVAAIERALLAGDVDVAVHSAKDVPTDEDPRLSIAAFLPRADPLDALVLAAGSDAGGLDALPPASRVGTDSPRRAGFLRAVRPDLAIQPLHGNVDTRLRRLDGGEVDALVLAVAGLARLGRGDRVTERLAAEIVPPAPGQGAIAVQVRAEDAPTRNAVTVLDDAPTRVAVEAERAFLRAAGGGCRAPIGALAVVDGTSVRLLGGLATEDGRTAIEAVDGSLEDVSERAGELASILASRLARMPMPPAQHRPSAHEPRTGRPQVLVTRPALQGDRLADRLRAEGLEPISVPAIAIEPVEP